MLLPFQTTHCPQPASQSPCGHRYMYGQPVQGVAYVRFGLLDEDGEKTFLRGLETQNKAGRRMGEVREGGWGAGGTPTSLCVLCFSLPQLVDGQSHIALSKAQVQGALVKLNMALPDLLGLRLYVAAAIIESPGG